MQLREFAEIILFEPSLQRKLVAPTAPLTDEHPGVALSGAPGAPARPAALRMPARDERKQGGQSPSRLEGTRERGLVLHAFANHELLALELMALALLRFPDAPTSFRLGLGRTMQDEQRHLRLYVERMATLGVALGDAPVSRFFWDCLADMPSPLDFVARMSLTLEQANLDFATHYERLFRAAGDAQTAAILAEVHQDEIGHVKHGVTWFNRWREPNKSEWDAYRELLTLPLTPGRAKGPVFEEDARRAAGLTPEFIRALKLYSHSKGRPPVLYWLNAAWEEELAASDVAVESTGVRDVAAVARSVERDLGALMLFLAKADDVVWVDRAPSTLFLETLRDAGFAIPQLVTAASELGERPFDRFEPWGMSRRARRFAAGLPVEFRQPDARPDEPIYASKIWASQLPEASAFPVRVCRTLAEVRSSLFSGWSVVKAPLGASGRNALRVAPHGIELHQARWIERTLAAQGGVLVEPWVERLADFSIQLDVGSNGKAVLGVTRFLTDLRGQYIGHWLNAPYAGLDPLVVRTLHEREYLATLERTGRSIAAALAAAGHRGPAGMDAFLYRTAAGDVALRPLVEVNARYTMGRIALALERRIHPGTRALWLHLPARRVDIGALLTAHPLEMRDGRLAGGALPTTDPVGAELLQTVIFTGPACSCASDLRPDVDFA